MKINFAGLSKTIVRTFHKTGFALQKHSPEILVVTGIAGVVTSAVMACKATTKLSPIMEKAEDELEKINKASSDEAFMEKYNYSQEDAVKDKYIVYVQTGVSLVKLYAPSVALGLLSLLSILASNNILRKRNMALAAAYAAIDKGFREYRSRIVERFGKEVDHEVRHNIKNREVTTVVTNPDGTETTITEVVKTADEALGSDYAKFFDESCFAWQKDPNYNLMFLRAQQKYANDRLITRGYLFLNEVYEALGIPCTDAGQIVGWLYNPENAVGDNFVDFGLYDIDRILSLIHI